MSVGVRHKEATVFISDTEKSNLKGAICSLERQVAEIYSRLDALLAYMGLEVTYQQTRVVKPKSRK